MDDCGNWTAWDNANFHQPDRHRHRNASSLPAHHLKRFSTGGNLDYSGITLDQGGAGQLTIAGNNTFANITNTYSATGATTLNFGTTTQRVANFTATGTAGNVLTIQGSSGHQPLHSDPHGRR
jgi:hypothetical protein